MDIPVVNVPDYPDRTPRRGPMKPLGPMVPQQRQGLTAPMADMSSSGPINAATISHNSLVSSLFHLSVT